MAEPECVCGHARSEHFGDPGRGPCMLSTEAETWACPCTEYEPSPFAASVRVIEPTNEANEQAN